MNNLWPPIKATDFPFHTLRHDYRAAARLVTGSKSEKHSTPRIFSWQWWGWLWSFYSVGVSLLVFATLSVLCVVAATAIVVAPNVISTRKSTPEMDEQSFIEIGSRIIPLTIPIMLDQAAVSICCGRHAASNIVAGEIKMWATLTVVNCAVPCWC